ncbi:hypothetical protein M0804_008027 [Polistes exclamans]|nr:hypothetical protein M0804_008027 [Polistes exclamans]
MVDAVAVGDDGKDTGFRLKKGGRKENESPCKFAEKRSVVAVVASSVRIPQGSPRPDRGRPRESREQGVSPHVFPTVDAGYEA